MHAAAKLVKSRSASCMQKGEAHRSQQASGMAAALTSSPLSLELLHDLQKPVIDVLLVLQICIIACTKCAHDAPCTA